VVVDFIKPENETSHGCHWRDSHQYGPEDAMLSDKILDCQGWIFNEDMAGAVESVQHHPVVGPGKSASSTSTGVGCGPSQLHRAFAPVWICLQHAIKAFAALASTRSWRARSRPPSGKFVEFGL
jgi:hypothetical protein